MPTTSPQPCGTYAAAKRHLRHGEDLDAACDQAYREHRTAYMREWREQAQSSKSKEDKKLLMRARSKAMTRLTHIYPDTFRDVLEEELRKLKGA